MLSEMDRLGAGKRGRERRGCSEGQRKKRARDCSCVIESLLYSEAGPSKKQDVVRRGGRGKAAEFHSLIRQLPNIQLIE